MKNILKTIFFPTKLHISPAVYSILLKRMLCDSPIYLKNIISILPRCSQRTEVLRQTQI